MMRKNIKRQIKLTTSSRIMFKDNLSACAHLSIIFSNNFHFNLVSSIQSMPVHDFLFKTYIFQKIMLLSVLSFFFLKFLTINLALCTIWQKRKGLLPTKKKINCILRINWNKYGWIYRQCPLQLNNLFCNYKKICHNNYILLVIIKMIITLSHDFNISRYYELKYIIQGVHFRPLK